MKKTKTKAKTVKRETRSTKEKVDPMQSLIIQAGVIFVIVGGFLLLMYVFKFYY